MRKARRIFSHNKLPVFITQHLRQDLMPHWALAAFVKSRRQLLLLKLLTGTLPQTLRQQQQSLPHHT